MPSDYQRIARTLALLAEPESERLSLADLAAHAQLSESHFHRLFSRYVGISPKRVQQYRALRRAQHTLQEGETVLGAAGEAGLSGPGRLHDLFVRIEGMTPGEYRQGGAGLVLRWGAAETPFGPAILASCRGRLCYLALGEMTATDLKLRWPSSQLIQEVAHAESMATEVFAAMTGYPREPLTVLVKGTDFQIRVWEALLRVPAGATVTYGELSGALGHEGASRAVGQAVGANPLAWLIPCHRVIRSGGLLGGYRWGTATKERLLDWERTSLVS